MQISTTLLWPSHCPIRHRAPAPPPAFARSDANPHPTATTALHSRPQRHLSRRTNGSTASSPNTVCHPQQGADQAPYAATTTPPHPPNLTPHLPPQHQTPRAQPRAQISLIAHLYEYLTTHAPPPINRYSTNEETNLTSSAEHIPCTPTTAHLQAPKIRTQHPRTHKPKRLSTTLLTSVSWCESSAETTDAGTVITPLAVPRRDK
jgi:hypothetical protein